MSAATMVAGRPAVDHTMSTIKERLDDLPGEAPQIAAFLLERDHTGRRGSAFGCPLNSWLAHGLSAGYLLRLDDDELALIDGQYLLRAGPTLDTYQLPFGATEFLQQFDGGQYPDLDATELGL